jgi:hypothetical protein
MLKRKAQYKTNRKNVAGSAKSELRPKRVANSILWLLILSSAQIGHSASVDPQISVGDPTSGTPVYTETFFLSSDAHGGGVLQFVNNSGQIWQSLDFFVTLPEDDTITCNSTVYGFCSYTKSPAANGKSLFDIGFEEPDQQGILPGGAFSIDLNDPHEPPGADKGSWAPFTSMEAVANFDIPEPASWLLITGGLILVLARLTLKYRLTGKTR